MRIEAEFLAFHSTHRCEAAHRRHSAASWRCSLRPREQYSGHSRQVARRHGQLEVLIDPLQAAEQCLPYVADRLAPAEVLLDALADRLTEPVAEMPGRARIDGAATAPAHVLGDVRGDVAAAAGGDEVGRVVGLVRTHRFELIARHRIEHGQGGYALAGAVGMGEHGADHQAVAVLHQGVPLVAQDRGRVVALAVEAGIGVGRARMGVVAARPAFPIGLGVASAARGRLVVRAVLGSEALLAGPGLDQGAVDREVFLGEQSGPVGQGHHLGEEGFDHRVGEQPVAVLGEHRVVPHRIVDGQPDEPAKQQVVAHLFHQLPLGAHRVEHLEQQRPHQLLRGDRLAPGVGIDRIEQTVQTAERFIDQPLDGAQRVIRGHEVVELGHREEVLLHRTRPAHPAHPADIMNTISITHNTLVSITRGRISTAC